MNKFDFVGALANIRPSATFLRLHHYKNEAGEIADYNIVFHIDYKSALERSIAAIENYNPKDALESKAKVELLDGYQKSISNLINYDSNDHYDHFYDDSGNVIKGVKLHKQSNTVHLYGAVVNKKVLKQVDKKLVKKSPLSIAKDKLRKLAPLSNFRQFKITPNQVDKITVGGITLAVTE